MNVATLARYQKPAISLLEALQIIGEDLGSSETISKAAYFEHSDCSGQICKSWKITTISIGGSYQGKPIKTVTTFVVDCDTKNLLPTDLNLFDHYGNPINLESDWTWS